MISGVSKEENRKYINKNVVECAEEFGFKDAEEFVCHLLNDENGNVAIINLSMCQDDIDTVAKLPYSIFISDAIYAQTDTPHPRMYGAFPKALRDYVKNRSILPLETCISKMTGLSAKRMGILNRGLLKEGYYADINIFDLDDFKDNATFAEPTKKALGLYKCFLNGVEVVSERVVLNRDAGSVIKALH